MSFSYELARLARGATPVVDSLKDLANITFYSGVPPKSIVVNSFHVGDKSGGGEFYWDAGKSKTLHNGGTVIDPLKLTQLSAWPGTWFTASASGVGCWVRKTDANVAYSSWFGASTLYSDIDHGSTVYAMLYSSPRVRCIWQLSFLNLFSIINLGPEASGVSFIGESLVEVKMSLTQGFNIGIGCERTHFHNLRFVPLIAAPSTGLRYTGDGPGHTIGFVSGSYFTLGVVACVVLGRNFSLHANTIENRYNGRIYSSGGSAGIYNASSQIRVDRFLVPEGGGYLDISGGSITVGEARWERCTRNCFKKGADFPGGTIIFGKIYISGGGADVGIETNTTNVHQMRLDETVIGQSSGASGKLFARISATGIAISEVSGVFQGGENIVAQSSGVSAAVVSVDNQSSVEYYLSNEGTTFNLIKIDSIVAENLNGGLFASLYPGDVDIGRIFIDTIDVSRYTGTRHIIRKSGGGGVTRIGEIFAKNITGITNTLSTFLISEAGGSLVIGSIVLENVRTGTSRTIFLGCDFYIESISISGPGVASRFILIDARGRIGTVYQAPGYHIGGRWAEFRVNSSHVLVNSVCRTQLGASNDSTLPDTIHIISDILQA